MPTQDHYQLVLCTCPNQDSAKQIADHLVDQGLAACVNILPGILSVYRWQGKREESQEHLLLIKTISDVHVRLEKASTELHPYELPEIIAVPIQGGNAGYLAWLSESINKNSN